MGGRQSKRRMLIPTLGVHKVMLASGGYSWIVVPVEQLTEYMATLEEASVNQNIVPFTDFLAGLIDAK